ncbi:MAG: protease inhibitor I42 family protein [Candidatus Bipolaricaulia bacterium]
MGHPRSFARLSWSAMLLVAIVAVGAAAESSSIVDETLLGLVIDAGVFQAGATLGLEIVGDGSDQIFVESVALLSGDDVIREEVYEPRLGVELWLGVVQLAEVSGQPLPFGEYSVAVFTSDGGFLATFSVASTAASDGHSTMPGSLALLGPTLRVHHLLTEADLGSEAIIRNGDSVMVALLGNPTTGFAWTDVTENLFPVLEPIAGTDYFPDPSFAGAVGGGGLFLFRYRAFAIGTQVLRFEYARPWETAEAAQSALFALDVVN